MSLLTMHPLQDKKKIKKNCVILETCVAMAVSALLRVSTAVLGIELGGHRTSISCIHAGVHYIFTLHPYLVSYEMPQFVAK